MAGFCFALTNALLRKLQHTPDAARAVAMFAGGTFTAAGVALAGMVHGVVPALPPVSVAWLPMALLLSLAFLAGNLALQYGAARLAAHMTALIMLSEVVFASLSAVLLGAADLNGRTVAGGAMIALAALLAAWPSAGRPPQTPVDPTQSPQRPS